MLHDLVKRNRSYRRFRQTPIPRQTLLDLLDLARLTPSAANLQQLRFRPVTDPLQCAAVYDTLGWAGYLPDWDGPVPKERPVAYIVILAPADAPDKGVDVGISAQTILLGAVEAGFGGCMLGNIRRQQLAEALKLPDTYRIELVIALGEPAETVRIVPVTDGIRYYRDDAGIHYVPKRALDDLLI